MFAVVKTIAVERPDKVEDIIHSFVVFMTDKNEEYPNGYAVQEWIDLNEGWVSVYKIQQPNLSVNIIARYMLYYIAMRKV